MNMWTGLTSAYAMAAGRKITDLFEDDNRAARFSLEHAGILFDYSKTNLCDVIRKDLINLARDAGLETRRDRMFQGDAINETEGRAVLHTALRNLDASVAVDGVDVMPEVRAGLSRMEAFANAVRTGDIRGYGGTFTDVVNIGIGGSDLGPLMACQALAPYGDGPRVHFVSNVDSADLIDTLRGIDPRRTLVLIASKTFTTVETMANARAARDWIAAKVDDPMAHFAAISTALEETAAFGVAANRVFGFEDWVGGRYSVWGPIGLSVMLSIGPKNFRQFLAGGADMDRHFCEAPLEANMPVLLALVGVWHNQICGFGSRAVIPYEHRLARMPAYLQQLEMESNGKSIAMDGSPVATPTGPIVWGEAGTNGQHAFFQLLHQGTHVVPCEFMLGVEGHETHLETMHEILMANCLAQSEALMRGRSYEQAREMLAGRDLEEGELCRLAHHRSFPGNRPSTTLIYPKLTPFVLGQLIALYEHRVFVEGVILGINSFDQWGVELGKELAKTLLPAVQTGEDMPDRDGSTRQLLQFIRSVRG